MNLTLWTLWGKQREEERIQNGKIKDFKAQVFFKLNLNT